MIEKVNKFHPLDYINNIGGFEKLSECGLQ